MIASKSWHGKDMAERRYEMKMVSTDIGAVNPNLSTAGFAEARLKIRAVKQETTSSVNELSEPFKGLLTHAKDHSAHQRMAGWRWRDELRSLYIPGDAGAKPHLAEEMAYHRGHISQKTQG